jgi:hypothetical protein
VSRPAALIASLNPGPGDFVFLLDENELREAQSPDATAGLHGSAWQEQQSELKEALGGLEQRKMKVFPYTFEKQGI